MAAIQERRAADGKTHYRVLVRLKGYPVQTATFERKTDAREWARQTEVDMKAGLHFKTIEAKRHTCGQMIDRYLRDVMPRKSARSRTVQTPQLVWWRDLLGPRLLADVTPALIGETRDVLANGTTPAGTPRSTATVIRYMAALSHCYAIAVREWGWLDDTPMRKVTKPKEPRGRVRFLSDDERARLLNACRESKSRFLYPIVVLAISTGMRRGEIMNLTWDRVDLRRRVIVLRSDDTKSREGRAVPIVGHAYDLLRDLSTIRRIDTNLVFPAPIGTPKGPKPLDIQSAWMRALGSTPHPCW